MARGEARPAYKRAFRCAIGGFHWQATGRLIDAGSGFEAVIALPRNLIGRMAHGLKPLVGAVLRGMLAEGFTHQRFQADCPLKVYGVPHPSETYR